MMDFSRIDDFADTNMLNKSTAVFVGGGGASSAIKNFARLGVGNIYVIDFDTIEPSNLTRQDFYQDDIGKYKVEALAEIVKRINPDVNFVGIKKKLQDLTQSEKDEVFGKANIAIFGTDSFEAQAYGNLLALEYNVPAIWAGFYAKSRTLELFFSIPKYTSSCFRCCASSRYIDNKDEEIKVSSNCNTIFHSQLLDSFIGLVAMAILHRDRFKKITTIMHGGEVPIFPYANESFHFFDGMTQGNKIDYNFFQFKLSPLGGNKLFDNAYENLGMNAHNFISYWQKVDAEILENGYEYNCPDCGGKLHKLVTA